MASSNPQIVSAGIGAGSPFVLGHLVFIAQANPPVLSSYAPLATSDGAVVGITSIPNSALVYNTTAGATEMLRVNGGMIVTGIGTDTVQIGRGASAVAPQSTVIGTTASDGNQVGVVIGFGALFSAASGVVIGNGASVNGFAGGATGIAIGALASGTNVGSGSGSFVVIGNGAVAHTSDVVIGFQATSSLTDAFGASNTVIGTQATANIASGGSVVIGVVSHGNVVNAVVVGGNSSVGITKGIVVGANSSINGGGAGSIVIGWTSVVTAAANIIIGNGVTSGTPNLCWIGGPGTDIQAWILGAGDTIATPPLRIIRFTNASGLNNQAAFCLFAAPNSTGSAVSGGFRFATGTPGGSSSTLQTVTDAMQLDGVTTAAFTRMSLWINDTGTVQRVQTITNAAILTLLGLGAGRLLYVPA